MQRVFLKMNPFVISLFFMLFSFDTAWQKSGGGGQCPPGPPGFDATAEGSKLIVNTVKVFLDNIAGAVCFESPLTILVCTQHYGSASVFETPPPSDENCTFKYLLHFLFNINYFCTFLQIILFCRLPLRYFKLNSMLRSVKRDEFVLLTRLNRRNIFTDKT